MESGKKWSDPVHFPQRIRRRKFDHVSLHQNAPKYLKIATCKLSTKYMDRRTDMFKSIQKIYLPESLLGVTYMLINLTSLIVRRTFSLNFTIKLHPIRNNTIFLSHPLSLMHRFYVWIKTTKNSNVVISFTTHYTYKYIYFVVVFFLFKRKSVWNVTRYMSIDEYMRRWEDYMFIYAWTRARKHSKMCSN